MKPKAYRYLILFFFLLIAGNLSAKSMKGYVVTIDSDTLYGEIKKYGYSQTNNAFTFNGIDLERYHIEVFFKELNDRKFKRYDKRKLQEFGFSYQKQDYIFKRFVLNKKSFSVKSSGQERFLNLVYSGEIKLYRNIVRLNDWHQAGDDKFNASTSDVYYDYYLFSQKIGLTQAMVKKEIKNMHDLLRMYAIPEEFIMQVPYNKKMKDIKSVLILYDEWKKFHQKQAYALR